MKIVLVEKKKTGKWQAGQFRLLDSVSRVAELDYVLTPGRYVGLPEEDDDFNFEERFTALKAEFEAQLKEEELLNKLILENLAKIK